MKNICVVALLFISSALNAGKLQDSALHQVDIVHKDGMFSVVDGGGKHAAQNCFVDSELRNKSHEEMLGYLEANNYFTASRMSDGEYTIHSNGRLPGGGAVGAAIGIKTGKCLAYFVGHGTIVLASALTGWGCVATFLSLEAQFAGPIESASVTAALAGGLIGGIATGPC